MIAFDWIGDANFLDARLPESPQERYFFHHDINSETPTVGISSNVLAAFDIGGLQVPSSSTPNAVSG